MANSDTSNAPKPDKAKKPRIVRVVDTTATTGPRIHEQIVNGRVTPFKFQPGEALEMPFEIAAKFLKHDGLKPVDENGQFLTYKRQPKQPEELQAGETIKLGETETIARFDELSSAALMQRALELPGGEGFAAAEKPDRDGLIAFLVEAVKKRREMNKAVPDVGADDFIPDAEADSEAA